MTVAELIEHLKTQPQDTIVAYKCHSQQRLLTAELIQIETHCVARPDGWIEDRRPGIEEQQYLVFPGTDDSRCKYKFRKMRVGDFRYVTGVSARHAQQAWYRMAKRNPEIAGRQFLWWDVNGGVKVERVG